jgi:hypothetical protein
VEDIQLMTTICIYFRILNVKSISSFNNTFIKKIQNVPGGKVNILGGRSKQKMYMYNCPIPNGFRVRAIFHVIARIKEHQDALRRATRHVLIRVAKCIDCDSGIFENVLY